MEQLHEILNVLVDAAILLFEFVGVVVIIISGVRGIYSYFRRDPLTRLNLAKGMAMGLEFKLGSEILGPSLSGNFRKSLLSPESSFCGQPSPSLSTGKSKTRKPRKISVSTFRRRTEIPLKPKKKNRLKKAGQK